ncbi:MAG: chloride channel protein [Synergistes sp.]|nr:chloride channel protein [Synergistes sp.]
MDSLKNNSSDENTEILDLENTGEIVKDEAWLMCTVIKWCAISIMTGISVGLVAGGFLTALKRAIDFADAVGKFQYMLLFPGLFASFFLVRIFAPKSEGHGTETVIQTIHTKEKTMINVKAVPVKIVATIITIASGGSLGIEGPCAQIGSGVSYAIGKIMSLDESDMKKIIVCGIAAGFCAVFGTPVAGAIFAVEVLFVGQLFYDVLFPSLISGITGYFTASLIGAGHLPKYIVEIPHLAPFEFAAVVLAGVFFGIIAIMNIEGIKIADKIFTRYGINGWKRPLCGAVMLLVLGIVFGGDYLGLGSDVIRSVIEGKKDIPLGFIVKIAAVSITLAAGGCGGEITPTLFMGASSGLLFSYITGLDAEFCSALGVSALLAASTNTPIAGTILGMEMFGSAIAPFSGVACAVAYLAVGHRSLYPTQILMSPKSRTFVIRKTEGGEKLVRRYESISLHRIISFYIVRIKNQITDTVKKYREK